MTTLKEKYLENCPDEEWGNSRGGDGETRYGAHLKHFLALQVAENVPNDFGEYMDFAVEATRNCPDRLNGVLRYAFDISDKYFSKESLKNKADDVERYKIVDYMTGVISLIAYHDDKKGKCEDGLLSIQVERLVKMATDAASWYGRHRSEDDVKDDRNQSHIEQLVEYCLENVRPGFEQDQNDMLLASADLVGNSRYFDLYKKDVMTRQLTMLYKQRHQLPNDVQHQLFGKIKEKTGVDGNEIFADLYREDKDWLNKNEAFIQSCEKNNIKILDLYEVIPDVFSDDWKHRQAFRTIDAIEETLRHDLNEGNPMSTIHFMGILERNPKISDDDVFFPFGQDRVAILTRDGLEIFKHKRFNPKIAPVLKKSYDKIYQNSSVRKKGLNKDDYVLVEEAAKNASKRHVQEAKERMLNRRAEKQAAIEKYNENKNKKFYTADDLEFDAIEGDRYVSAKMVFDNGWGIAVDRMLGDSSYYINILDKSGKASEKTALSGDGPDAYAEFYGPDAYAEFYAPDEDTLNKFMKDVQKLDENGKLPPEYSEAENAVSGVVVADKIAEGIQEGTIYETVTPEKGRKLSESIKRYLNNRRQKG